MNSPATVRPPGRSRLALIVAGVLALLGSFAVTAPAQAGYYDDSNYGYNYGPRPCSYRCGYGYSPYRYARRYNNGCSACGCYRRCGVARSGVVYERRYVEREYVERRYGYGGYRRHYGYNPYGAYRGGYGYGGVGRRWTYGYQSSADGYEEPPQPPAQVWDEGNNY